MIFTARLTIKGVEEGFSYLTFALYAVAGLCTGNMKQGSVGKAGMFAIITM